MRKFIWVVRLTDARKLLAAASIAIAASVCAVISPVGAQVSATADARTPAPAAGKFAAEYVGGDTCTACHSDIAKGFENNPHSQLALEHAGKGVTCESCHGPGKAHVDSGGDVAKIVRFTKATAGQINQTCLSCHAGAHPNFERSAHGEAELSCTSCHSIHYSQQQTRLLIAAQPQLCYRCHADVRASFSMPFHHKVPEALMKCSDCHDPHGTFAQKNLQITADRNMICTKCHTETAGPFVYEHPVLKTGGCTSCHSPHGSPNPRLLHVNNVNTLCLQCHTASMNFTEAGIPSFHNQNTQYVACTNCHTQIHGSNASSVFFK